jgi:hypothetical protein
VRGREGEGEEEEGEEEVMESERDEVTPWVAEEAEV